MLFDEATRALDKATENEVMHAIDALLGGKTLVMIAHRLTTASQCCGRGRSSVSGRRWNAIAQSSR